MEAAYAPGEPSTEAGVAPGGARRGGEAVLLFGVPDGLRSAAGKWAGDLFFIFSLVIINGCFIVTVLVMTIKEGHQKQRNNQLKNYEF